MKKKENLLNVLIAALILFLVAYLTMMYINAPVSKTIKYPADMCEFIGDDVKEWKEYVKQTPPTRMIVYVRHITSLEVPQVIEEPTKIKEVLDIILSMKVTKQADKFQSEQTAITYYFEDETTKSMSFTFQEELLKTASARYNVDNIKELYRVKGINLYLDK